jgi:hypothetical protein
MNSLFWQKRLADSGLEFIHPLVYASRILQSTRPISDVVEEILDEEPLPSRERKTGGIVRPAPESHSVEGICSRAPAAPDL